MKGSIINASKANDIENIDSVFKNESLINKNISLSIYSRPQLLMDANSKPYRSTPYRNEASNKNRCKTGPLEHYQSSHSVQRTQQIEEIRSLKDSLTKNDVNISVVTIEKAILFPEDRPEEKRSYPKISDLLFKNPFEKKKKKGKKGKKGKKKK